MSRNKQLGVMRISVKLPEEMWERISHLAVDRHTSVQALAQEAMEDFLFGRGGADTETAAGPSA